MNTNKSTNLEGIVETENNSQESPNESQEEIFPLEEYTSLFINRYNEEKSFRDIVHKYLGVSKLKKTGLVFGKKLKLSWYKRKTNEMVLEYATKIREDLVKAVETKRVMLELQRAEQEVELKIQDVNTVSNVKEGVQEEYQRAVEDKEKTIEGVIYDIQDKVKEAEEIGKRETQQIMLITDVRNLVRNKLKDNMINSPLIKVNENGRLEFDEQKMCEKLEDVFLSEIIEGIEKEDGKSGFIGKIKTVYEGLIGYYDDIEDLDELSGVDWVESIRLSRIKGYRIPTFPYLITGKPEKFERGKISIDTAITLDSSTSMNDNNRFFIAKKTALATAALMRKLNQKNETYLSHFNGSVYPVSNIELMRSVNPINGTATELALDWLLETLTNKEPCMAYLITDGDPNNLDSTISAAKKFRDHPYILLRIFLIDGNEETEKNIRNIGSAAGPLTKVIPVKNYQLSNGIIRDISKAIGDMYNIAEF